MVFDDKKISGVDWALIAGIMFWVFTAAALMTIVNAGRVKVPRPVLEITAVASAGMPMILTHHGGDPVWFANTRCLWTPDIKVPTYTEKAGALILSSRENRQGRISKFEPGEKATLTNAITLLAGQVGRLDIRDLKSGRLIFTRLVYINN